MWYMSFNYVIESIRVTIHAAFQTLAGVLNLVGPPLLGLLASRLETTTITITITSRFDTATVMLVLGASLVLGAAPLALASLVSWARAPPAFAPVPQTSDPS